MWTFTPSDDLNLLDDEEDVDDDETCEEESLSVEFDGEGGE